MIISGYRGNYNMNEEDGKECVTMTITTITMTTIRREAHKPLRVSRRRSY